MPEKPGNNLNSLAAKFTLGGILLIAVAAIYFYGTPKQFEASATIRVWKSGNIHTNGTVSVFGPELLPAECRVILSAEVLDRVVTKLTLNEIWGERFNHGKPIKTEQARDRLRLISRVQPFGKSSVIDIRVTGEEPIEPARIANGIAAAYRDLRQNQRSLAAAEHGKGLREQWNVLTARIQDSRKNLDRLYFEINAERATNRARVLSPDGYSALQSNRIDLESQYVRDKANLERLKAMDRDRRREVLSTLDTDPNSLLNNIILQLLKARRKLAAANTDHGPDSPEVKQATSAVAELDKRVNQQANAIMESKAKDLAALESSLEKLNQLSRHASTNLDNATLKTINEQDAAYNKARKELAALEAEQDRLQQQMNATVADDVVPVALSAEILDSADVPMKPAVPDPKIALTVAGTGGLAGIAGLALLLMGSRVRKVASVSIR